MRWFTGRSTRDREHLVQTLQSLGPTSVAGLSAALSWSERRTERAIQEAIARGYGAIRFDPARRSVGWAAPEAPTPAGTDPTAVPAAAPAPTASAAPPPQLPKSWGASAKCPSCQVAYQPTGTDGHLYCPQCGRLTAARSSTRPASEATPATPAPRSAPAGSGASPTLSLGPDRRSQELFAAWVTAQTIPCPKCRTPLRHHGVAEYACPSCGARVAFERSAGVPAPSRTPPASASSPPLPAPVAPPAR
jgi:uncharacterized Zn finger protein (UPF0148 family)